MDIDEILVINHIIQDLMEAEDNVAEDMEQGPALPRYHTKVDAFRLTDEQFIKNFRLPKYLVRQLIELVSPHMPEASRNSAIRVEAKVSRYFILILGFY